MNFPNPKISDFAEAAIAIEVRSPVTSIVSPVTHKYDDSAEL